MFERLLQSPWRRRATLRCALVVALGALPQAACHDELDRGMHTANDLMYSQKYAEAERLYSKLLQRTTPPAAGDAAPESTEAARGRILSRLGQLNALYLRDYGRAIANYETLAREAPQSDAALTSLTAIADLYRYKLGDIQGAIDADQRLVTFFGTRPEARRAQLNIVTAYAKLKNYQQARLEAEALIARHPDTTEAAQALFAMAEAYYGQKRYSEGIATYERILANHPDASLTALVSFELGNGYQNLGDSARALDYFYRALAAHPNPQLLQRKIARVRARLHQTTPVGTIMTAYSQGTSRRPKPRKRAAAMGAVGANDRDNSSNDAKNAQDN